MMPTFGRSVITYLLATFVNGATALVLLPVYARVLGPAEYGQLDIAVALGALLTHLGVGGLDTAIGIAHFRDEPRTRAALATVALGLSVGLSAAATAAGIVLAFAVIPRVTERAGLEPALIIVAAIMGAALLRLSQSILRQSFRAGAFLAVALVQAGTSIAVGLGAVIGLGLGAVGAAAGYAAGWTAGALLGLVLVRPRPGVPDPAATARRLLRLALPVAPAGIAVWIYSLADRFILGSLQGTAELGLYAAAARVAAIAGLAVVAGQLAWGPLAMSVAPRAESGRFYAAALLTFSVAGALIVVASAVAAPLVIGLLLGPEYERAAPALWLLVTAVLLMGVYYLVAIGLNISERTGDIARSTWLAALANIALNLALVPTMGFLGSAVAAAASFGLAAVAVLAAAQRSHPVPYRMDLVAAAWLAGSVGAAAQTWLDALPRSVALVAVAAVLVLVTVRGRVLAELRWAVRFIGSADHARGAADGPAWQ